MRPLKLVCLLTAVFLTIWGLYSARYVVFTGPQLSKLAPDDVVVVDYWTGGCDHNQHYMLTFRPANGKNVRIDLMRDAGTHVEFDDRSQSLISVQPSELSALDDYLRSRRTHFFHDGWSTEVRRMNISWFQGKMLRHHESFIDRRPDKYYAEQYEDQRGMTFEDLVRPIYPSHIDRFGMTMNQEMHVRTGNDLKASGRDSHLGNH